eukprot:TRINITY_DN9810_c0_g2_i2.p1 TRINITY_DN9810_c0_g2~~TRINITY_DN9810_c0_g2_i2.p1  ORF type:complete len:263 (-),score=30.58 TRINITY_DN9810_c0_g2_i2:324-1112(-)
MIDSPLTPSYTSISRPLRTLYRLSIFRFCACKIDPFFLTIGCLWEILCAVTDPDVELLIRLPRSQRRAFHDGLAENFDVILDSLMKIDARKAEAYHQHDKDMIFKAIESSIGFDLMNERVKEPLRRWYLTTTVDITNAMLMMEDPSERQGRLLLNVGRALFDFGQYESALHFLRHAAATVSNLSGDVHPDVAEAIHHQSRALMKLGQMEQALDTATRGLMLRQRLHGDKHLSVAESINMQVGVKLNSLLVWHRCPYCSLLGS